MVAPRKQAATSAREFLPERITLTSLRDSARGCQGCPIYRNATQTVFGDGPRSARVVLVGEQPGDEEDIEGKPFVGPAGRLLDRALELADIDRGEAYVTNVVKHFKWEPRGKRRLHSKPSSREVEACMPWLEKELELIEPEVLVCLGATAAQAILGRDFRVSLQRGRVIPSHFAAQTVATVHPSSILRQPTDDARRSEMDRFVADLKFVAQLLNPAP
jgi:DNA polymerase